MAATILIELADLINVLSFTSRLKDQTKMIDKKRKVINFHFPQAIVFPTGLY